MTLHTSYTPKTPRNGLTLRQWMDAYDITELEAGETLGKHQSTIHKSLKSEKAGERSLFVVEGPENIWNLIDIKVIGAGSFPWV